MSEFRDQIAQYRAAIEEFLQGQFCEDLPQKRLFDAMRYSLLAGGKRIRPILTLEFCRVCGGDMEKALPFAAAVEMVHTYSLIHDDLPALDNDEYRRGKKTTHVVYGEAMAILAGDALLNYAYEIMLSSSLNKENSKKYLKAIYEIAKHAGIYGMIGGQVVDVESENKIIDKDKLDFIHLNKTAAMIVGCMRAGAIIGDASEEELEKITKYSENIGLSFQIVDDILDIVGDEEKLGKPIGSDIENHKSTYPSLLGLEKSRCIARQLIEEGKSSIKDLPSEKDFLNQLGDYIISRDC